MPIDPFEYENELDEGTGDLGEAEDNIQSIGTSNEWTEFRNNLAQSMASVNQVTASVDQGTTSVDQGKTSVNRNYRTWTTNEDEKLIEALLHMVNTGAYKADNGFKSGYLQTLETALNESLPNSGILGKPHIESRIRTMKKDWQAVYDMLHSSGFGYDEENNCATTDAPGVWDSYISTHKRAAKLRDKKLANYPELCLIFGKDRAQGNRAKLVTEMQDEVNNEEQGQNSDDALDEVMEGSHNARTNMSGVEEISSVRSKKRKNMGSVASLAEVANNAAMLLGDRIKESSSEMSEGIKLEVDLKKKTSMITSELQKMKSLSKVERFRAIRKIKSEPDSVLTFWDLKEDEREEWVQFMLSE
ncbi:myb/SANT-like domain, Harbinger transposase-derived nuclease domain protein [Artemisia annua]|uniref:Myb/SANT-like domain, Harbinger transposase-derived nuclease domain protein n=1 Tax=Artemisia annua TaxID=35608 RepID=A0A2U1MBN9_ARTAN|nr:myb/SANT-like domain, Harbinger transposase-derived nuclease domain protein [Artemisia annua]